MTPALRPGEPWQPLAACTGDEAQAFHSKSTARAKKICRPCPVRAECLHDALASDAPSGVWGGLTVDERHLLPALPASAPAAVAALREVLAAHDLLYGDASEEAVITPPTRPWKASRKRSTRTSRPDTEPETKTSEEQASLTPAEQQDAARAERRAKIAEMLRAGATHAEIRNELRTCSRTVASVREEYGIPRPTGPGFRYTPEERAENERRAIPLLRAGASYKEVKEKVGISAPTIIAIRRKAGIPKPDPGRFAPPPRSVADGLAQYVEAYGDGHARWTGPMTGRMPQLWAEGERCNARHVVFERHHGRPPVGYVRSNCVDKACIAGAHLTDDVLRETAGSGAQAAHDNPLHQPTQEPTMAQTTTPPAPDKPAPTVPPEDLSVEQLLDWADTYTDPDVQASAQRTRAALVGLRNRYDADHELARIDTETARLEQELAGLRARRQELAPAKPRKRTDPSAAAARAWAKETGVDCPASGRVPGAVMDAWRQATGQAGDAPS